MFVLQYFFVHNRQKCSFVSYRQNTTLIINIYIYDVCKWVDMCILKDIFNTIGGYFYNKNICMVMAIILMELYNPLIFTLVLFFFH